MIIIGIPLKMLVCSCKIHFEMQNVFSKGRINVNKILIEAKTLNAKNLDWTYPCLTRTTIIITQIAIPTATPIPI